MVKLAMTENGKGLEQGKDLHEESAAEEIVDKGAAGHPGGSAISDPAKVIPVDGRDGRKGLMSLYMKRSIVNRTSYDSLTSDQEDSEEDNTQPLSSSNVLHGSDPARKVEDRPLQTAIDPSVLKSKNS